MENNTQCTTISGQEEEVTQCIAAKQEVYGKLILVIYLAMIGLRVRTVLLTVT